jgi:uncharacterized membrane protein
MEWFVDNWPVVLVILAVAFLATAIVRKLVKLAFFAIVLGVIGFVIWPLVTSSGT